MSEAGDDPSKFTIANTHKVAFVSTEGGDDSTPNSGSKPTFNNMAAGLLDQDTSQWCAQIKWVARWTNKGLQPVKPVLATIMDMVIPPGVVHSISSK